MAVVKIVELLGTSSVSFDDALNQAVNRASKTLRGVSGADVLGQNIVIKQGKIIEYRVNLKVSFGVE